MAKLLPSLYPAAPVLPADVVVFGEALVDLFPDQPGAPLEDVERFARHLGGAPANLAVNLSRQGLRTALITRVGADALGRFVQKKLASEGVATDGVGQHKSARTGLTFVSVGVRGERSFLFYRHPSADMMITAADLEPAQVLRGRVFHCGSSTLSREPSRSATLRALELAKKRRAERRDLLLSCDLNLRQHLWPELSEAPPLLRRLIGDCDIVKLTRDELPILFGTESLEAAAEKARKLGPAVVAITLGESGCFVDCPAGQCYLAGESTKVVDKTGAGDAFTAGLLASLFGQLTVQKPDAPDAPEELRARLERLTMDQVKRACMHANHLGALACTAIGATTAIPRAPFL